MKTKVTIKLPEQDEDIFPMSKMKPGQICTLVSDPDFFVRRFDYSHDFIIEGLSGVGSWWGKYTTDNIMVKPAPPGTKIIFEVVED